VSHPFLMFFHNPNPNVPIGSREHHPSHKLPNLETTATLHQTSLTPKPPQPFTEQSAVEHHQVSDTQPSL